MTKALWALVACAALSACNMGAVNSAGSAAATIAESTSTTIPNQATTLGQALQAATLVTKATDTYVTTANPSAAQLRQIKALSAGVHAALVHLEQENAAGHSLIFASFNAALQAFNAYKGN